MQFTKESLINRILQYILFWMASYIFLVNTFQVSLRLQPIDYIYGAIFQITLMLAVHFNLQLLMPRFLLKRRYLIYVVSTASIAIVGTWFNIFVFSELIDYVLPDYYFISYYSFLDILKFFAGYLLMTTLLKLSKAWLHLTQEKERIAQIEKEKTALELKALRLQVNPHFLFNSLNVLYALVLKKSDASANAIIKLSDILRHVLYESNKNFVTLQSEIKLIHDYIDLQKYRIGDTAEVTFEEDSADDGVQIAPMILLPLVENSFKHGLMGEVENTFVRLKLSVDAEKLNFVVENNRGQSIAGETNQHSGIGIKNIRNRLNLIYPKKHKFTILEMENTYKVNLEIKHAN